MKGGRRYPEGHMAKSGKVAIVTGSATGLGASCAIDLAGRGWNVAINYTKSKKEADETYETVKGKGVEAILVQADMGQDADCRKLAAETLKKQWEDKQERGAIVNISSIAGVMGVGSSIPYACSKGALNTLTLTLARWFSPAVRVNTVCPGFIQTRWLLGGMGEENYNKMKQSQEQTAPLRQAGTPEQMAEAVLFFLTSASNITGEFLIVDAGIHLASLPMKAR